jgi:hypothetical protein
VIIPLYEVTFCIIAMTTSSRAALLLAVAMAAAVLGTAHSATYTVGAPAGSWDLQTNYTAWASTITFRARDQLGVYLIQLHFIFRQR